MDGGVRPDGCGRDGAGAPEKAEKKAGEHASEASGEGEHGGMEIWKWANFAILAGGLGYLIGKNAGPFFAGRTQQIRKDMIESGEMRKQAEARAAEVDRRLASLETEIAGAAHGGEAGGRGGDRAARAANGRRNRQGPIARRTGYCRRGQSRPHGIEALLRRTGGRTGGTEDPDRMNPDVQNSLVMGFVKDLDGAHSSAQTT